MITRLFTPWYRPRNVILALALAVITLLGLVARKVLQPPGKPGAYALALEQLVSKGQPAAGENGWDLLVDINHRRAAAEASLWSKTTSGIADGLPPDYSLLLPQASPRTSPKDLAEDAEIARRARLTIEALIQDGIDKDLDAMAAAPRAVRAAPTGALLDTLLPELGPTRQTARMLTARMRLAAQAGDLKTRARSFDHLLALARITAQQHTLIDRLVGIAIAALATNRLQEDLVEFPLPAGAAGEAAAAELLAILDRQMIRRPMRDTMEGERYFMLDTINWCCTDDGDGNGLLMFSMLERLQGGPAAPASQAPSLTEQLSAAVGIFLPSKADMVSAANEFFRRTGELTDSTRPHRRTLPDPGQWVQETLGSRYMLLGILTPALEKAISADEQCRMQFAAARLMLAIELYRCREGKPPATLAELVPGIIPELPIDAISGKPFGYSLLSADPAGAGRTYLLYSLGDDATDNDGNQPTGSSPLRTDALQSGTSGKGFDYVINQPPPKPPEPEAASPGGG